MLKDRLRALVAEHGPAVEVFSAHGPDGFRACLRLVRARAAEQHEEWQEGRRYLNVQRLKDHKKEALRTLGGAASTAVDLSATGRVVGSALTASGARHAFAWSAGRMADLRTLGGSESAATDVNDRGQVVAVNGEAVASAPAAREAFARSSSARTQRRVARHGNTQPVARALLETSVLTRRGP